MWTERDSFFRHKLNESKFAARKDDRNIKAETKQFTEQRCKHKSTNFDNHKIPSDSYPILALNPVKTEIISLKEFITFEINKMEGWRSRNSPGIVEGRICEENTYAKSLSLVVTYQLWCCRKMVGWGKRKSKQSNSMSIRSFNNPKS